MPTPPNVPLEPWALAFLLSLQLLGEVVMEIDPTADGSVMFGRAMGALGSWDRLGQAARAPGTPLDPAARPAITELRALIARAEPMLARIARPLTPPR